MTDDLERALADPRVQAVVLATPHSLHTDQIVRVAQAGKPVFCEKPFALKRADAERSVAACARAGRRARRRHQQALLAVDGRSCGAWSRAARSGASC